jgi:hypothetical protein
MKDRYETHLFDDGTEPTVWARSGYRALGTDQQGRYPEAAEATTDIGQDDDLNGFEFGALLMLAVAVAVTVVVGALTLLGGGV